MVIYPLIVGIISLLFGATVLAQFLGRRRPQQLVWSVALGMAAVASFAFVGFLIDGNVLLFRLYYLFGALLMAAYLGMGSLYLMVPRRWADTTLVVLLVISLLGAGLVLGAPVDTAMLHHVQQVSGAGTGVLKNGLWLLPLILLNIFGAAAVIVMALYSAYRVWRRQAPRRLATANITIAVGTAIISAAGSSARLGWPSAFWVVMALGWIVIFAGFLLTTTLVAVPSTTPRARTAPRPTALV